MSLFRRKREDSTGPEAGEESTDGVGDPDLDDLEELEEAEDDEPEALPERPQGPWDESEVTELEGYIDLGAIAIKAETGMELRLEIEEATQRVTSATIQLGPSAVQLQAFAAPRDEGIWEEIRDEIAAGITRQGGTADVVPGVFGRELLARVPVRTPDGRTAHQPVRFTGVDGPRWFLRAVFHGTAAYESDAAETLEGMVRSVVVRRGPDAMAPRDLLTLHLPDGGPQPAEEDEAGVRLDPFERGPEITEIR